MTKSIMKIRPRRVFKKADKYFVLVAGKKVYIARPKTTKKKQNIDHQSK